jgi:hypothetical protein
MKSKMGSLFAILRGPKSEADTQAAKPISSAVPTRKPSPGGAPSRRFPAVAIKPGAVSCQKAIELSGVRKLARHARIPLSECTMPDACTCSFQKYDDRRGGDDRRLGLAADQRLFLSPSQRNDAERRGKDTQNSPRDRRLTGKKP